MATMCYWAVNDHRRGTRPGIIATSPTRKSPPAASTICSRRSTGANAILKRMKAQCMQLPQTIAVAGPVITTTASGLAKPARAGG